ncbi:putative annexin [Medicago truncatula]|uniref:Putative annexin n=1 Tax=Medicago truncatula TaxID=3880 RepID=A0A396IKM9_MEDTR|nr:putative annexin [Medicago truncatula]
MVSLIAPSNHSPVEDAEVLQRAVKGWGADEKAIIAILGHRNGTQRTQIRQAYYELYQEDLIKRLEFELSGDFEVHTRRKKKLSIKYIKIDVPKRKYILKLKFC